MQLDEDCNAELTGPREGRLFSQSYGIRTEFAQRMNSGSAGGNCNATTLVLGQLKNLQQFCLQAPLCLLAGRIWPI
jgi:hypothetical protein